jgi:hypothetical protein
MLSSKEDIMATIRIQNEEYNHQFVVSLAADQGYTWSEENGWLVVHGNPSLRIPRQTFDAVFDPTGTRAGDPALRRQWRSLIINREGHLEYFGEDKIVIRDRPAETRPQFLIRFPDADTKAQAELWASRAGYESLTDYILAAIEMYNELWAEHAKDELDDLLRGGENRAAG